MGWGLRSTAGSACHEIPIDNRRLALQNSGMNPKHNTLETGCKVVGLMRSAESIGLDLLRDIDATVESLASMTKVVTGMAEMLHAVARQIDDMGLVEGEYVDPDDVAVDGLLRSVEQYKNRLVQMVLARKAVDRDGRLASHHCEALHDAYSAAELAVGEIIEALQQARASIIRHDLAAEPRGQAFDSIEALIESLHG